MTQNLRLAGGADLTSADSNVTRDWTLPTTALEGNSYTYTAPQTTLSDNTEYGGYYNYCAASAGTVCQVSTAQDATQDICPKGWKMPSLTEMQTVTSYASAFSPVYGGNYYDGTLENDGSSGTWWSSTANGNIYLYYLGYNNGSLNTSSNGLKYIGFSIRCIQSS